MNRVKETLDSMNITKNAMYGSIGEPELEPTLFLVPMLAQIALSLAVIADKCTEEDVERRQDEGIDKRPEGKE